MPKASLPRDIVKWLPCQNTTDVFPQSIAIIAIGWPIGMHVQIEPGATKCLRQECFCHHPGSVYARGLKSIPHPVQKLSAGPLGLLARHEWPRLPWGFLRKSTR